MMAILSSVIWYRILIFLSLLISDVGHLLVCLLYICMSYLEKGLFRFSAHFLLSPPLFFLILSCMSYNCGVGLEINPYQLLHSQIFFPYVGCLYILFMVFFAFTLRKLNSKRHRHPNVHWSTVIIARIWKQPKCPLTDKWIKCTMNYYTAIKRRKIGSFLELWWI